MPPRSELMPLLEDTLYSGYVGQGPRVAEFEAAVAGFLGNPNVLAVNSGTSAIQLALRLANVRGGTVVTTPMTCAATNLPILAEGARPVWADIDPATGNIDADDVAKVIRPDTRAIIAVHWGGQPCDLNALNQVAASYGIPLIEDAAHAFGATWEGVPVGGATADFTCFSLQAIKHVTTADGGVLTCRADADYDRGKLLRWYGIDRDTAREDNRIEQDIAEPGLKWHMNDVTATIGLVQLRHLPRVLAAHREHARLYRAALGDWDYAGEYPRSAGAWWLFTVLLAAGRRDMFAKHMAAAGVSVSRVHARNDTHTCFAASRGRVLPGVDEFSARMCCIPVHWALTAPDLARVTDAMQEFA